MEKTRFARKGARGTTGLLQDALHGVVCVQGRMKERGVDGVGKEENNR